MKTKGLRPAATSQHRVHQTIFADGRELRFINNDRNGNDLFSFGHGQVDREPQKLGENAFEYCYSMKKPSFLVLKACVVSVNKNSCG